MLVPRAGSSDSGAVAVMVVIALLPVVLAIAALGIDLSLVRLVRVNTQNAVDAAALAGVVHLPGDPNAARREAMAVAVANGLAPHHTEVEIVPQAAARLRVTAEAPVSVAFAGLIGAPPIRVRRSAESEYAAPLLLGSPCNIFGREDMDGDGGGADQGPVGTPSCSGAGNYWAGVMGAGMDKSAGDAFGTSWCAWPAGDQPTDGCALSGAGPNPPGLNLEHRPGGYSYIVRVQRPGVLRLQGYDIGWVSTGPLCRGVLGESGMVNPLRAAGEVLRNEFVQAPAAPHLRYIDDYSNFCSGDTQERYPFADDSPDALQMTTSVAVSTPQGASAPLCPSREFPGIEGLGNAFADVLQPGAAGELGWEIRETFHRWVDLCPGTAVQPGDYRITVRAGPGSGANRFALRAWLEGQSAGVTIAAEESMHVYSNFVNGSSLWHLVRLDSSAAGRTIEISVFDIGDAEQSVELELLAPDSEATMGPCTARGAITGLLPECRVTVQRSVTNGRWLHFEIPVTQQYRCPDDTDMSRCWVKARVTTPAAMFDATTWNARVLGDPIRLVR